VIGPANGSKPREVLVGLEEESSDEETESPVESDSQEGEVLTEDSETEVYTPPTNDRF